MEYDAIVRAIWRNVDYLKMFCIDDFVKLLLGIKPRIGLYNVYGQIVFGKAKCCAYFLKLFNATNRHNDWGNACNSLDNISQISTFVIKPFIRTLKIFSK